jgi:limonene-1,2-epoxide hydrolase
MADPADVAARFWDALYDRDWPRTASFFGPESIYYDVPIGPTSAARGPADIEARLRLGLDGLAGYEHGPGAVATGANGLVVTEHTETWHWPTGEVVTLPFVSVQRIRGDTIMIWRDYWDYSTLVASAPAWWVEHLADADLSWIFDATGLA